MFRKQFSQQNLDVQNAISPYSKNMLCMDESLIGIQVYVLYIFNGRKMQDILYPNKKR